MKALTVVASAASGAGCCAPTRAPMRAKQAADFRAVLRALADDTRLRIVSLLAGSATPVCVCDIEARFELSQPTISHHLKILRKAGLVRADKQGTWVYYALVAERVDALQRLHAELNPTRTAEP
jgi:ArsR family transcriptional regulator